MEPALAAERLRERLVNDSVESRLSGDRTAPAEPSNEPTKGLLAKPEARGAGPLEAPRQYAPIAVFCYNRPGHLKRTLTSLQRCDGFDRSHVYVFADGPRDAADRPAVEATRRVAESLLGPRAQFSFSESNRGLARSIIEGVSEVLEQFGRLIVIEDDLELAPAFLEFMNEGLDRYDQFPSVMQISGYMFSAPEFDEVHRTVFLPLTSTWGWATWSRAWTHFDATATGWQGLRHDATQREKFNMGNSFDYATMLERQMRGRLDSWGIRWYWSVFRRNGIVAYAPWSLVRNHGMDGSGTHGRGWFRNFSMMPAGAPFPPMAVDCTGPVHIDSEHVTAVRKALARSNGGSIGRLIDALRRALLRPR